MIENALKSLKTDTGKCIVSIILGIGFATIFRKSCESRNCMIFNAPAIEDIKDNVYKHDNKCYKFTERSVKCNPQNNKQVEFA